LRILAQFDGSAAVAAQHAQNLVEIGFDTPFKGAMNQPWHRDFRSPPESWRDRCATSLAFNLTGVDVTSEVGPFEIAAEI
jgi:ectoine hydroxylase-related dioxygenase (phytanoyl-CoA dioxygenase family)